MTIYKSLPQGAPCDVYLSTTDTAGAKEFYAGLFGWTYDETPMDGGQVWIGAGVPEGTVAGITGQIPEMAGHPGFWSVSLAVHDVDAIAAKVAELGGTVEIEPVDVMEIGRMAMIKDPTGARVSLWQAAAGEGSVVRDSRGAIAWNEIITADIPAAKSFYGDLFDATWTDQDFEMGTYSMLKLADDLHYSGAMELQDDHIPPHWNVYFAVDDTDAAASLAEETGGKVLAPPFDIPGVGRVAYLVDPAGATFWVMKAATPDTES